MSIKSIAKRMSKYYNLFMKKIIIFLTIIVFLFSNLIPQEKESLQKIYKLHSQKKYKEALKEVNKAMKQYSTSKRLIQLKYTILLKLKKYDEALQFIENEIKKRGEIEVMLAAKSNILLLQKKFNKALKVALKKDKITRIKSPWDCINIANIYIQKRNKMEALNWLDEAVKRGFIDYRQFENKKYNLLKNEKRLLNIIDKIKLIIGLGEKAKDFSIKLFSGETFTLSKQRGKVILVDFWAFWCKPCTQEIANIKKYYPELKSKGFEIIGISLDSIEKKARAFIKKENIEWKISCSGKVWKDPIVKRYGVNSIPSYWLIDKNGFLRSFGLNGERLKSAILQLLME